MRLEVIDTATMIDEINIPGYRLHELKGDRQGTWSIKVSGNWRITFTFNDNNAYDIDFEDYHSFRKTKSKHSTSSVRKIA